MFSLVNGKPQLDPDLMAYPQFRNIWERDTTPDKREAWAYFSYMFHFHDPKSPLHKGYPESVRREKVIEKVFTDEMKDAKLYNDKDFIQACVIFKESLNLSSMRGTLDFAKQIVWDIQQALLSQKTKTGTKLNDLIKLNKVLAEMKETERMIDADEKDSRVKGGRHIKDRERA